MRKERHSLAVVSAAGIRRLVITVAALALAACASAPTDPGGTLDRVGGGKMRVGITQNDPWTVISGGEPRGIEVEIVESFAEEIEAEIEWFPGSEEELFGALKLGTLDLVIGGFAAKNPYVAQASLTHPYLTTQIVVAVPSGDAVPEDIAGLAVAVEEGTEEAGLLEKTDASVVLVDDIETADGPRVVDDWLLDDLELVETGVTLIETDHVMAVRLGENGWLVTLERFLLERPEEIERILNEKGGV